MTRAWVWLLSLMLGLSFTVGCDDPTVAENIDVFTCAWLPWWMADCSSTPVHDRAISVLHNGFVEAKVECKDMPFTYATGYGTCGVYEAPRNYVLDYKAIKFQDGSCLVKSSANKSPPVGTDDLLVRSEANAPTCGVELSDDLHASLKGDGYLTVHTDTPSYTTGINNCHSPFTTPDTQIDLRACTGVNLSAFGVSP